MKADSPRRSTEVSLGSPTEAFKKRSVTSPRHELTAYEVPNEVRRSMVENAERLPTLEQVHQYVAHTLSRLETLEPDRFPLTQQILNRSGKPCGIYYCLQGPRAVRLTAIWETEQNTILFYGSCGRRMQRTRLLEAPLIGA